MNATKKAVLAFSSLALLGSMGCQSELGDEVTTVQQNIVGGSITGAGQYPWMAQIIERDSDGVFQHACAGSLIAEGWVLTAAHCVSAIDLTDPTSIDDYRIRLGEHDREVNEGTEQEFTVADVIIPDDYSGLENGDIALVRLSECAELNDHVQLIRLTEDGPDFGDETVLTGWGYTEDPEGMQPFGSQSRYLKEAITDVVNPYEGAETPEIDDCREALDADFGTPVNDTHICTLVNETQILASGCFTDSGGPLVVHDQLGRPRQVGIHISGDVLCRSYSLATDVETWLPWIRENVPDLPSAEYQAEDDMDHITGGPHPEGWNIWDNSYISFRHDFDGGPQEFVVTAAGQFGNGWPNMLVTIDGQFAWSTDVEEADWTDYLFEYDSTVGEAEVRIYLTNDFYQSPVDRNLFLDKVVITSLEPEDELCPGASIGDCTAGTADFDLGSPGQQTSVPTDACLRVQDGYPSSWNGTMKVQNPASGASPVEYEWINDCAGGSGAGTFEHDWDDQWLSPTSNQCATLIQLKGDGSSNINILYWAE